MCAPADPPPATDNAFCWFFDSTRFDSTNALIETYIHVPVVRGAGGCNHMTKSCLVCPGMSALTVPRSYTVSVSPECTDVAGTGGEATLPQLTTTDASINGNGVVVTAVCPFISAVGTLTVSDLTIVCVSGIHAIEIRGSATTVAASNIHLRHTVAFFRSKAAVAVLNSQEVDEIDVTGSVFRGITADGTDSAAVVLGHAVGPAEVIDSGLTVIQPIKPSLVRVTGKLINVSALTSVFGRGYEIEFYEGNIDSGKAQWLRDMTEISVQAIAILTVVIFINHADKLKTRIRRRPVAQVEEVEGVESKAFLGIM